MKALAPLVVAATAILLAAPALGQQRSSGFWGGADLGYASLKRKFSVTEERRTSDFALGLRAGYFWRPQLLLGFEIGGWTLENANFNDPSEGEGLSTLLVVAQYYPNATSPFFLKGGLGAVSYWNNRPNENGGSGTAGVLGIGRDFRFRDSSYHVSPLVDYSWGRVGDATTPPGVAQDFTYRAITFRVGVTYR